MVARSACIPSHRTFMYTHHLSQYFPTKDTVVEYWWCVHLALCLPKIQKDSPLMNQQRILSLLPETQNTIRYYKVWNAHWWVDRYILLLCFLISPFRQRWPATLKTVRRSSAWNPQLSQSSTDKWTLTRLSHNRLIVPHKVSIFTLHTQLPFSPHTKKVLTFQRWKSQEGSSATFGNNVWLENNQDIIAKYSSGLHTLSHYKSCECYHTCRIECFPVTMDAESDINRLACHTLQTVFSRCRGTVLCYVVDNLRAPKA